ncbi:RIP metalloprotease RseP [Roseateles depolymerans]|uniref:Zinc metalloprotease n=1 Tax=Roseateles depolymerans TaxID=76731 RepID=A0A0U3L3T0_9BURK|nr:RIP metalloprotease RseP [Roseateles depolymerans]ALV05998.1 RIP metalloprotease RseP [Roseateles depolymerans]REG12026.1 site-2 protease [Roseateles depolymerans]
MPTTLLAFVVTLGVLIIFHEWGHYRMARACGVKVLRFSLGFGPVLGRWKRGADGTEFVLSLLPLGGYVRLLDDRFDAVPPDRLHESLNQKSLWQRSAIVLAGPMANLVLAVLLFAAAGMVGQEEPVAVLGSPQSGSLADAAGLRAGDRVQAWSDDGQDWQDVRGMPDVTWQLARAVGDRRPLYLSVSQGEGHSARQVKLDTDALGSRDLDADNLRRIGLGGVWMEPVLGAIQPDSPAQAANLRAGDRVISVNDRAIADLSAFQQAVRQSLVEGCVQPMRLVVQRGGESIETVVTPRLEGANGQFIPRIGVGFGGTPALVTVHYGPMEAVQQGLTRTWQFSTHSLKTLWRMLTGEASVKNLSSFITIADYAGQSARLGAAAFLGFLASVSVSLGVLNLLPVPMLDGGHLMYYLFEGLSGRPVSERWRRLLERVGITVLLLMMSLALFNDLTRQRVRTETSACPDSCLSQCAPK